MGWGDPLCPWSFLHQPLLALAPGDQGWPCHMELWSDAVKPHSAEGLHRRDTAGGQVGALHSLSQGHACTSSFLRQLQVELLRKDSDGHFGPK